MTLLLSTITAFGQHQLAIPSLSTNGGAEIMHFLQQAILPADVAIA